jgi:deoxyhypusine synthase
VIDLSRLRTHPIRTRKNKVRVSEFVKAIPPDASVTDLLNALPDVLAGKTLRQLVAALVRARREKKPIIWALGAHVLKCGLSPLIIEALKEGWVSCLSLNGAGIIHDYEVATIGETSEEVAETLRDGSFGMVTETLVEVNRAINEGVKRGLGLGESMGRFLLERHPKAEHLEHSIVAQAAKAGIPVTVHVAIGCDTIHMHASADGAAIGEGSLRDFRRLAEVMTGLSSGAVFLNVGSAVILPEVFLKALSLVRNLGFPAHDFVTANMDMLQHYRPSQNVVSRPTGGSKDGTGYTLTGHHEIMLPLLIHAARAHWARTGAQPAK